MNSEIRDFQLRRRRASDVLQVCWKRVFHSFLVEKCSLDLQVIPFLIKRAKDKKKNVRDAILSALSSVSDTTSSERLLKDIIDWFSIPSPESKQTLLSFLFSYWCRQFQMNIPFVRAVAPLVVKVNKFEKIQIFTWKINQKQYFMAENQWKTVIFEQKSRILTENH